MMCPVGVPAASIIDGGCASSIKQSTEHSAGSKPSSVLHSKLVGFVTLEHKKKPKKKLSSTIKTMAAPQAQQTAPPANPSAPANANAKDSASYASASLYVGDLLPEITEANLCDIFNQVGPVQSIRVCRDAVTRRPLGYAYVNFRMMQDAERALDTMNYSMIKGHPCRIMWSHRDPSLRKSNKGNIFIKNLDKAIDNKMLYDTFSTFGNILSCKIAVDDENQSKGYGFVHYEDESSCQAAMDKVNGKMLKEKIVYVGPFKSKKEREDEVAKEVT